ncbi:hypothetical protein L3Q82_005662 [Scortum barcoo]|uniref:Uncharacterized protein n=1 Tax=Scortum barcoo TaxID=214431 RepID=A0ACB8V6L2_9TELE|nr:hypothetical protein L3Q82_005662 [Scortum barcoo]
MKSKFILMFQCQLQKPTMKQKHADQSLISPPSVQNFPSDPVRPGDSVTLQCSVLSDYENKTCPGEHSVYWFRAGSDGAHPTLIYVQRNNSDQCEKSHEAHSPQKCVYNFSKNVSSSDAGTYHCAVATCGEILFGDGRKLDIQAVNMWNLKKANGVIILLCASLAISLIVIALLIDYIKKKTRDCNAAASLRTNVSAASSDQQSQQVRYAGPSDNSLVLDTRVKRGANRWQRRKLDRPGRPKRIVRVCWERLAEPSVRDAYSPFNSFVTGPVHNLYGQDF